MCFSITLIQPKFNIGKQLSTNRTRVPKTSCCVNQTDTISFALALAKIARLLFVDCVFAMIFLRTALIPIYEIAAILHVRGFSVIFDAVKPPQWIFCSLVIE
jgi:hypothetical protein